jgi:hypothetical protein
MCMTKKLHPFKKITIVLQRRQEKLPSPSKKQMCIWERKNKLLWGGNPSMCVTFIFYVMVLTCSGL